MILATYFDDFLKEIRLSDRADFITAHTTLRELLKADDDLKSIIISTFLQGSYRRYTAINPEGDQKPDVDIVVVTNLPSETTTPSQALGRFKDFLNENYEGKWKLQARSIAIEDGEIEMDLVVTSAPSEVTKELVQSEVVRLSSSIVGADEQRYVNFSKSLFDSTLRLAEKGGDAWKSDPLLIPDREVKEWKATDPLAQMAWTTQKNTDTSGHYVNVVKALKWWKRRVQGLPKYPKGYPLEHIIGQNCPDGITSVAEGVVLTLEAIYSNYSAYALLGTKPFLPDHGVPEHDVLARVDASDFKSFHEGVGAAATAARKAYDEQVKIESWKGWYDFFGDPFPKPDEDEAKSLGQLGTLYPAQPKEERFS